MKLFRSFGVVVLIALTMGAVGYLTWLTEPSSKMPALSPIATQPGGFGPITPTVADTESGCGAYDAWAWAQTVFVSNPRAYGVLDPDGNGVVCETLPVNVAAPILWASSIPPGTSIATLVRIVDGDTIVVMLDGVEETVRLKAIDTPEVAHNGDFGEPANCGGQEASTFLRDLLRRAPDNTLHLEFDGDRRDRYGRLLAYVWLEANGKVYLAQEALARNGWGVATTYRSDTLYRDQMMAARQFSIDHVMGVPLLCGAFGQPIEATPDPAKVAEAKRRQPDQGQFPEIEAP